MTDLEIVRERRDEWKRKCERAQQETAAVCAELGNAQTDHAEEKRLMRQEFQAIEDRIRDELGLANRKLVAALARVKTLEDNL